MRAGYPDCALGRSGPPASLSFRVNREENTGYHPQLYTGPPDAVSRAPRWQKKEAQYA